MTRVRRPPVLRLLLAGAALLALGCEPAKGDRPMTDFHCAMEVTDPPAGLRAGGAPFTMRTRFTNKSAQPWPGWRGDGSRIHTVSIGSRWWPVKTNAGVLVPLFEDLAPGEAVVVDLELTTPDTPGDYILRVEPVQNQISWFGDSGQCVAKLPVTILP